MAFETGAKEVSTASAQIVGSNTNRKEYEAKNTGDQVIYISGTTSTVANGFPVDPQETFNCNDYTGAWYGIVSTLTSTMDYFEGDD